MSVREEELQQRQQKVIRSSRTTRWARAIAENSGRPSRAAATSMQSARTGTAEAAMKA
jgi:hypothetical protein